MLILFHLLIRKLGILIKEFFTDFVEVEIRIIEGDFIWFEWRVERKLAAI